MYSKNNKIIFDIPEFLIFLLLQSERNKNKSRHNQKWYNEVNTALYIIYIIYTSTSSANITNLAPSLQDCFWFKKKEFKQADQRSHELIWYMYVLLNMNDALNEDVLHEIGNYIYIITNSLFIQWCYVYNGHLYFILLYITHIRNQVSLSKGKFNTKITFKAIPELLKRGYFKYSYLVKILKIYIYYWFCKLI